jgi:hypothetical protein
VAGDAERPAGTVSIHLYGEMAFFRMMPDAALLRDSTQILLPEEALDGLREELEHRFTLTIRSEDQGVRIVGSPVEIKEASAYLSRNGISVQ